MIVSCTHQFIFVHNPKAGGTSIKRALRTHVSRGELERVPKQVYSGVGVAGKHSPIDYLARTIQKDIWNSYFKFAFVRNPWSWLVSVYEYAKIYHKDTKRKVALNSTFEEFVRWLFLQSPKDYLVVGGQLQFVRSKTATVDFVGRVEHMQRDFSLICEKIKIPKKVIKKHNNTKHRSYVEYYKNSGIIDLVARHYANDISAFKYKFGE